MFPRDIVLTAQSWLLSKLQNILTCSACICACVFVCTCVCVYVCAHVYVYMCVCMHVCMWARGEGFEGEKWKKRKRGEGGREGGGKVSGTKYCITILL